MSSIERSNIISDEALEAPLLFLKNLEAMNKGLKDTIGIAGNVEKSVNKATSTKVLQENATQLAAAQEKLIKAQKQFADSQREVEAYQKSLNGELRSGTVEFTKKEQEAIKAANAATAFVAANKNVAASVKKNTEEFKAEAGTLNELVQKRDQLAKLIKEESQAIKDESEALEKGRITQAEFDEQLNTSNTLILEYKSQLTGVNEEIKAHTALEGRDAKTINEKNASLKVLDSALAKNRLAYSRLTTEEARNSKEGKELLKIINQQDESSKRLSRSIGQNQKAVGGYTEAIKQALDPLTRFSTSALGIDSSVLRVTRSISGLVRGANVLKVALLGIPIFALIAAFTALAAYFKGTEEGAQRLRIVLAAVGQVFNSIKDVVIGIGESIADAFAEEGAIGVLKLLGNFIKDQIAVRFNALWTIIQEGGKIAVATFILMKEKLKAVFGAENREEIIKAEAQIKLSTKNILKAFIDLNTGVEDTADKLAKFYSDTADKVKQAIRLQEIENKLIQAKRRFLIEEAELNARINKAREEAADSTKTEEERLLALADAEAAINELAAERTRLKQTEIYLERERQKLSSTDEASMEKLAQLEADLLDTEAQRAAQQRFITRQRATLQLSIIQREKELALQRIADAQRVEDRIQELRIQSTQAAFDAEVDAIRKQVIEGTKTRERAEREILNLRKDYAAQAIQLNIDTLTQMLIDSIKHEDERIQVIKNSGLKEAEIEKELAKIRGASASEQAEIEKAIYKLRDQLSSKLFENHVTRFEDEIKIIEDIQVIYENYVSVIGDLFAGFTERRLQQLDAEEKAINKKYKAELDAAGNNEKAKKQIELEQEKRLEEIDRKRLEAKRKDAVYEKATALVSAAIQTSLNILKVFPNPILTALAASLGAIQIAAIAARPIPAFKHGGITKGGKILIGEDGAELMRYASGKFALSPDKPTVMDVPANTVITPSKETSRILALAALNRVGGIAQGSNNKDVVDALNSGMADLKSAVLSNRVGNMYKSGSALYYVKEQRKNFIKKVRIMNLGWWNA